MFDVHICLSLACLSNDSRLISPPFESPLNSKTNGDPSMSITAFLPYSGQDFTKKTVAELRHAGVENIYLIANSGGATVDGVKTLAVNGLTSTGAMEQIAKQSNSDHVL